MFWSCLICLLALDGSSWRFVSPPPGDPFEHPALRAITLSANLPAEVTERVAYRGKHRRYAQVRLGGPGSPRVTVVVDEVGPGEVDLYVDANRNRRIEDRDKVAGAGRSWRVAVPAAFVKGEVTKLVPHEVVFRLGTTGRTLSAALVGYWEGTVEVGGGRHAARRADADLDGTFAGPSDRLWVDLNDDGQWDAVTEQFLFAPTLKLGGARCVVVADVLGERLELRPDEGTGTIRLALARPETRQRLVEVHALLVGRDGAAIGAHSTDTSVEAPVGEYRLSAVAITLADPSGGPTWNFVFSDSFDAKPPVWRKLERGQTLILDPIGALESTLEILPNQQGELTLQPRLHTGDGLLINSGTRGTAGGDGKVVTTALVTVQDASGRTLDATTSGFS